jgi:hypothetical protein
MTLSSFAYGTPSLIGGPSRWAPSRVGSTEHPRRPRIARSAKRASGSGGHFRRSIWTIRARGRSDRMKTPPPHSSHRLASSQSSRVLVTDCKRIHNRSRQILRIGHPGCNCDYWITTKNRSLRPTQVRFLISTINASTGDESSKALLQEPSIESDIMCDDQNDRAPADHGRGNPSYRSGSLPANNASAVSPNIIMLTVHSRPIILTMNPSYCGLTFEKLVIVIATRRHTLILLSVIRVT